MADNSKHHPQRLRTFASDMQAVRKELGQEETPSSDVPIAAAPTPIAAAPKPIKTLVQNDQPKEKEIKPAVKAPTIHHRPVDTPSSPTKIPAFHELQKSVTTIQKNSTKVSHHERPLHEKKQVPKHSVPARPNIGYDATVITDTKSERFKLFPSIVASLKGWFKRITAKKPKKVPKYTVPETERRKGVIQKATSKTGTIFTADSETLKEQIRRRHIQEELEDEAETIWTPFTETGFSLLEAPEEVQPVIQNVTVEYKKQPQYVTPTVPAQEAVDIYDDEVTESEEDPLAEARWGAGHDEEVPAVIPETKPRTVATAETPVTPDNQEEKEEGHRTNFLTYFDTNTLTVILLVTIIGLVAIVFIARVVITKFSEVPAETVSIEVPSEPLLSSAKLVGIPLTVRTIDQLPQLVNSAVGSSSMGLIEFAIVSAVGDEVSASYLFDILHFRTTPNLRQSLTTVRFATVNHSKTAIILRFVDTDAVRGGLLNWEATLPEDLAALYDLPTGISPTFTDEVISGIDARVLRHNDKVVLVYGIAKSDTAVITSNTNDFAQIVELGLLR